MNMRDDEKFITDIVELFKKYSIRDVASSLFVSSLWLPNISAVLQQPFLVGVFASIKPGDFNPEDQIKTYEDFQNFCKQTHALTPSFATVEDMIPELDWGEIEYYFKHRRYHIFYGSEISNVYDHLEQFDLIHNVYNEEYLHEAQRSPEKELKICLQLQDHIIQEITTQKDTSTIEEFSPGHTEVPTERFWSEVSEFYKDFNLLEFMPNELLERYSLPLGSFDTSNLESNTFANAFHEGTLLPFYCIKTEETYLPVLPRRYSAVLFDQWRKLYEEHSQNLLKDHSDLAFRTGVMLTLYMQKRFRTNDLYELASAATADKQAHDIIFHSALLVKNKLIVVHVLPPLLTEGVEGAVDFDELGKKLQEALDLLRQNPPRLLLRAEGKGVEFRRADESDETEIEPVLFVVMPEVSTGMYLIPANLPGHMVGLPDFLMILDEVEDPEELAAFSDFLKTQTTGVIPIANSMDDIFAAFKQSYGVLIGGARQPDFVWLDSQGGSFHRYDSLRDFWVKYPKGYFGNPRHLKIVEHNNTSIRLVTRASRGFSFHCKIGKTEVAIWAPFHELSYEQGEITDLLLRCLEDALSQNRVELEKHRFFDEHQELRIAVFPSSYASNPPTDTSTGNLKSLLPEQGLWKSEASDNEARFPIVRIVFDEKEFAQAIQEVINATLEMNLALEIFHRIDEITPDSSSADISKYLEDRKSGKPRFVRRAIQKEVAFPDRVEPHSPSPYEYKLARKRVSEIADSQGVTEGTYEGEEAIKKLNSVREVLVKEIDEEVAKYDLEKSLPFLLERHDALENEKERTKIELGISKEHDVDFDRTEKYAEQFEETLRLQKQCRYIIEKFVQLQPKGAKRMTVDDFKRLSGLVNWLHVLYSSSDCLKYQTHATALIFNHENIVEVGFSELQDQTQEEYMRQVAGEDLSPSGNKDDRVEGTTPFAIVIAQIDAGFRQDYGFSFRNIIHVLHVLSKWSFLNEGITEQSSYSATEEEIVNLCLKELQEDITADDVRGVLKFLALQSTEVISTRKEKENEIVEEMHDDIPVWEHIARLSRYDIRPLIFYGGQYFWGPYAARMAEDTWKRSIINGSLPAGFPAPKTEAVLRSWSKEIQDGIEKKALDVAKRHTSYADSVDLKSRFPQSGYEDVGDYDVLAYLPKSNTLLNVECKEIPHTYCMKDAKRLRTKIFGWPKPTKESHFPKILRREQYLRQNLGKIAEDLSWPIDQENPPRIINVYVTRHRNWWMKSPPNNIEAEFQRIDLLDDFIQSLKE